MSDWIKTKAGLQMADTITRQLPRISKALEVIAKSLHIQTKLKWSEQEILRLAEEEQSNFGGEKDNDRSVQGE